MPQIGLLEQPLLLLVPAGQGEWDLLADSGMPVGFVYPVWEWAGPPWLPRWWPVCPPLAIHEQDEEPLVFTIHRCWSFRPWFEVLDAENHPIGHLLGPRLWDRVGRQVAGRQDERFLSPSGQALAELSWAKREGRLHFLEPTENPFTRMLLLAAALVNAPLSER